MSYKDEETKRITAKIVSSIFQFMPEEMRLSTFEKIEATIRKIVRQEIADDKRKI